MIGTDANGAVAIDTPVFKGEVKLPKLSIDADDFDINGVHLYPGSTVSVMNIDGKDSPGGNDSGSLRVSFHSPAKPSAVRDWFRGKLDTAGFEVADDGTGLSGTTDEKKPFRLTLSPDGADKAEGTITIG